MTKDEVLKLAKLARIELADNEAESLTREFESIISYVSEVQGVSKTKGSDEDDKSQFPVRNVLREDANPHESGIYTEAVLKGAPNSDSEYIKVKKIL